MKTTQNESRMCRLSDLLKGGAKPRRSFALMMALVLVGMLSLAGVVSADNYYAGTPPVTGPYGTVTGDVSVNFSNTWSATNNAFDTSSSDFTLQAPATGKTLKFARLYVVPYAGSMSADYFGNMTVTLTNGSGTQTLAQSQALDRSYNNVTGTSCSSSISSPLVSLCRVTSDYVAVFDVTNYIDQQNINVGVTTYNITKQFDGRIKEVKLVYGWDQSGSSTNTKYWINEGQDPITYSGDGTAGETVFDIGTVGSITAATLYTDDIASANGVYTWNESTITPTTLGSNSYARLNQFTLDTSSVQPYNTLTYNRVGNYYKLAVAVLKLRY